MEGPNAVHQAVLTELMVAFHSLIKAGKGKSRVFPSPFDVELFPGGNTVLQPDLVIICDRSRLTGHVVGAPDLVVEIISPSTRRKDHGKKLALYMAAGVREYWIVDPYRQTVVVYDFRVDALVHIYGFGDRIPVAIWDNACCVDFAEIKEAVADLMEE